VSKGNVSAVKVNQVQLVLDEETAELIRQLAYAVNWDQFPNAEKLNDEIAALGLDVDVSVSYSQEAGEFTRD
jgi:hypothetical protein